MATLEELTDRIRAAAASPGAAGLSEDEDE